MIQMRFGRGPVFMPVFIGSGGPFSALKWKAREGLREQKRWFLQRIIDVALGAGSLSSDSFLEPKR